MPLDLIKSRYFQVASSISPSSSDIVSKMPSSEFSSNSLPSLKDKVFLVTGGNTGIGQATVAGLAMHEAKVYMGTRSREKALDAIKQIQQDIPSADIEFLEMDLANLDSVVRAAKTLRSKETSLHGLVNNAGVMAVPYSLTQDGYEIQFQTNYLSHWLLTYHLLPLLITTAKSTVPGAVRIVNVTSDGHSLFALKKGIDFDDVNLESSSSMKRYCQSKLGNILHAVMLNKKYGPRREVDTGAEIWVAAVHPGHIYTNLNKQATATAPPVVLRVVAPLMKVLGILDSQDRGALSSLFAIASPSFGQNDSGSYVVPYAKTGTPSAAAQDTEMAEKLWSWTWAQLKSKGKLDSAKIDE